MNYAEMSSGALNERYERLSKDRRTTIPRDATLDEVVPVSNGCRGCAVNWTDGNFAGNSQDRQNMNDFDYLE